MNSAETSVNNQNSRDFVLSPCVRKLIDLYSSNKKISPLVLIMSVIKKHPEYGGNVAAQRYKYMSQFIKNDVSSDDVKNELSAEQWLDDVADLYDRDKIDLIHGRIFLIGLAMINQEARQVLIPDQFLENLIREVREEFNSILTEKGKERYESLFDRDDDTLDNSDDNPIRLQSGDTLERADFANFLVDLLTNTDLNHGAFAIHLHAPWGAGKTSFMNFMKEEMATKTKSIEKKSWITVDFNAWQNQSLSYPWWVFMNNLYDQVKGSLSFWFRLKVFYWRLKTRFRYQMLALLICCPLLYAFSLQVKGHSEWLENTSKILSAAAGVWALAISVSKSSVGGMQKAAQYYLDSRDNPMEDYKEQFRKLVQALKPARLAVYIDDLDRCKSVFAVDFMENLQTIFKEENVVFIIAADTGWLTGCYEVEYDKIKPFVSQPGKNIGPLFMEKMFQLSVALPGVPDAVKQKSWEKMLGMYQEDDSGQNLSRNLVRVSVPATDGTESAAHNERVNKLKTLSKKTSIRQTEHFLRSYSRYLDLNPRNMKRLLNSYLVNKAASVISQIYIPKHQLALWTIIEIQWPVLSAYFARNPDALDLIGAQQQSNLPDDISLLLNLKEVLAVLKGEGINQPLEKQTVLASGLLFSCLTYHGVDPRKNSSGV